jgi:hypothetical protein
MPGGLGRVLEIRGRVISSGGDISGGDSGSTVTGLQGVPVSSTAPTDGEVLMFIAADGEWIPALPVLVNGA